jgi:hypothetical protein
MRSSQPSSRAAERDADLTTGRRELDGVVDQVAHDLLDAAAVGDQFGRVLGNRQGETDAAFSHRAIEARHDGAHDVLTIDRFVGEGRLATLELQVVEHAVDETAELQAFLVDDAHELGPLGRVRRQHVAQQLRVGADVGERRAQFVRDAREEPVLQSLQFERAGRVDEQEHGAEVLSRARRRRVDGGEVVDGVTAGNARVADLRQFRRRTRRLAQGAPGLAGAFGDLWHQRLPQALASRLERRRPHGATCRRVREHDLARTVDHQHALAQRLEHRTRPLVGELERHGLGDRVAAAFGTSRTHGDEHAFPGFGAQCVAFDDHRQQRRRDHQERDRTLPTAEERQEVQWHGDADDPQPPARAPEPEPWSRLRLARQLRIGVHRHRGIGPCFGTA